MPELAQKSHQKIRNQNDCENREADFARRNVVFDERIVRGDCQKYYPCGVPCVQRETERKINHNANQGIRNRLEKRRPRRYARCFFHLFDVCRLRGVTFIGVIFAGFVEPVAALKVVLCIGFFVFCLIVVFVVDFIGGFPVCGDFFAFGPFAFFVEIKHISPPFSRFRRSNLSTNPQE